MDEWTMDRLDEWMNGMMDDGWMDRWMDECDV